MVTSAFPPLGIVLFLVICCLLYVVFRIIEFDTLAAAARVRELEAQINEMAGERLLTWETDHGLSKIGYRDRFRYIFNPVFDYCRTVVNNPWDSPAGSTGGGTGRIGPGQIPRPGGRSHLQSAGDTIPIIILGETQSCQPPGEVDRERLSFVENAAKTSGPLTITDGTQKATVTLFGQYVAAGFHAISDGTTGSVISYSTAFASHLDLAGKSG